MDLQAHTNAALQNLSVPAIASPMFLVSNPKMVIETCKAGMVGSFPALNQRTNEGFDEWLTDINNALSDNDAPYAVNLIVHRTNLRLEEDVKTIVKHKVPIVITSLGLNQDVIDAIHSYGGLIFHDVAMSYHAIKAVKAGVDGLILVSGGAGGHAGTINPFAFVGEVRKAFKGTIILAGCISNGADVAAAKAMGANFAYMGTRFIATEEANASKEYKDMVVASNTSDIVYTPKISGIPANFLAPSLVNAGIDPKELQSPKEIDLGDELTAKDEKTDGAWTKIWSAGQGVGSIDKVVPVAELVADLVKEYAEAKARV